MRQITYASYAASIERADVRLKRESSRRKTRTTEANKCNLNLRRTIFCQLVSKLREHVLHAARTDAAPSPDALNDPREAYSAEDLGRQDGSLRQQSSILQT